jgi:hypothetical protein
MIRQPKVFPDHGDFLATCLSELLDNRLDFLTERTLKVAKLDNLYSGLRISKDTVARLDLIV